MPTLNAYLARHFFNRAQLAAASGVSCDTLDDLLSRSLIPAPSYVVKSAKVRSAVFGEMSAPDALEGQYFHRDTVIWLHRALECLAHRSREAAYEEIKGRFRDGFCRALGELDRSIWRLTDCFSDDASLIGEGFTARFNTVWKHFLNGTYGLCVARPLSEHAIAYKEVLQEKLIALTANGSRTDFTAKERQALEQTIVAYAEACSSFSPLDYPRSSRKRLVDDLRVSLNARARVAAVTS